MSDQSKKNPPAKINQKQYQQMLAKAPSFAQSMVKITQILGTKPVYTSTIEKRQFTDNKAKTFQEMDEAKTNKIIAE